MDEPALSVVMHVAPDGRGLPTTDFSGRVLAFRDRANARSFARGLVEAGLADAMLGDVGDLARLGASAQRDDDLEVFEDGVVGLSGEQMLDAAHRLALDLAPPLLRRY